MAHAFVADAQGICVSGTHYPSSRVGDPILSQNIVPKMSEYRPDYLFLVRRRQIVKGRLISYVNIIHYYASHKVMGNFCQRQWVRKAIASC